MNSARGAAAAGPRIIAMRCVPSAPGGCSAWHAHPFDEFTLVTDDSTVNGHAAGTCPVAPNTLLHFRPGERHGHWNDARQRPRFWVVHFALGSGLRRTLLALAAADPRRRIWQLSADEAEAFKSLFVKLVNEHTTRRSLGDLAETAWLQLMLISVARWAAREANPSFLPEVADARLLALWHTVNEAAAEPARLARSLRSVPGYDSLRHRFKREFGCPPARMALRLRIEQAKSLLLETPLSVKAVAARVGYPRQHEFTRAFRRVTGRTPTGWRRDPAG